jgi:hypothetical protein
VGPGLRRDDAFRDAAVHLVGWLMPRLRYTRAALLLFGAGLLLGFVVVVGEFDRWGWTASTLMAVGLVLLPAALLADGHGFALIAWIAARFRRNRRPKPRPKSRRATSRRKAPARGATRPPRRRKRN